MRDLLVAPRLTNLPIQVYKEDAFRQEQSITAERLKRDAPKKPEPAPDYDVSSDAIVFLEEGMDEFAADRFQWILRKTLQGKGRIRFNGTVEENTVLHKYLDDIVRHPAKVLTCAQENSGWIYQLQKVDKLYKDAGVSRAS